MPAIAQPVKPLTPPPVATAFGPPAHSPDHLDFGQVWDGESAMKTLTFTTQNRGPIRVEIPAGPFYVTRIREVGPTTSGGKNTGQSAQIATSQQAKGTASFAEGQPGPWMYSAVAAGDQLLIDVVFKPKFDISTMMAGPKSASMKVSGPGVTVPWTMSVPLSAMFGGKHTMPLLVLPENDIMALVTGYEQAWIPVRVVAAGEDVSGNLVFPSLAAGLSPTSGPSVQVSGSETKDFQIAVRGAAPTAKPTDTPLNGTLALQFTRKGQTAKQQTPPVGFRVSFVPDSFSKSLATKSCNGVSISRAEVTITASGMAEFSADFDAAANTHFEVFFPQAKRTLLHTSGEVNAIGGGHYSFLPIVRAEENSPMTGVSSDQAGNGARFSVHIDPGPKDSLNRYRALLHSSAELRCW